MQPVIPQTCEKILDKLAVDRNKRLFSTIYDDHDLYNNIDLDTNDNMKQDLARDLSKDTNIIFQRIKL